MNTMTPTMLSRYLVAPDMSMDEEIRSTFGIPARRFYSISMNPATLGRVTVDLTREREVKPEKISKSNQP